MNIMKNLLVVVLLFTAHVLPAQKNTDAVFTVGKEPVTVEEFKYIYEKNNAQDPNLYSAQNLREYLDLYINFKLKVKAARESGMDTTEKFRREYENYRNQLAQPYLTDRQVTQALIDEGYARLKEELRASHILIALNQDAPPKDTIAAYNKAMEVYNKAIKGEDFEQLARAHSQDPSVANNGGDLGYFTAFQMIYPFESAAYNLKKEGEVSKPVRTRFGYHVVKLTDRRPYRGEILVRHILVTTNDFEPKEKQQTAQNKIDSIYNRLVKGADFGELARQHSDHLQSRQSGGELPAFNSFSQYPDEFKNAAFSLAEDGEYTKPIRTSFGWHLIQRVGVKKLQTQQELDEYLKSRIARDTRSDKSREAALAKFKQDYNFKETPKNLTAFNKMVDTTLLHGQWALKPKAKVSKELFVLDGKKYTQKDFAEYLQKNQQRGRFTDKNYAITEYYNEFVNQAIYNYVDNTLETKYTDFRNVAKEYKEGILLFEVTDKNVWTKAMEDSTGLQEFYDKNKDKYRWGKRADVMVFELKDKATADAFRKKIAAAKTQEAIETIANDFIKKDPLSLSYKKAVVERGELKAVDTVKWEPGLKDAGLIDGRYNLVYINKLIEPGTKALNEIKGIVIADYQEHLEKEWLATLRNKFPVQVNDEVVSALVK